MEYKANDFIGQNYERKIETKRNNNMNTAEIND